MRTTKQMTAPGVAVEYAAKIKSRLGKHARHVILFGSHARGTAIMESDYDFVVIVDKRTRNLRRSISKVGASLLNEKDALCAALVYDDEQWENIRQSPIGWNIEREGIFLL